MKTKQEYFSSKKFINSDITLVITTFNSQDELEKNFKSVPLNLFKEVIVMDGFSSDKTLEYFQRIKSTIVQHKDFNKRVDLMIEKLKTKYLISIETDHFFKKKFFQNFIKTFLNTEYLIHQSKIDLNVENYFCDKLFQEMYDYFDTKRKVNTYLNSPLITFSELYQDIIYKKIKSSGASIDTETNDLLKIHKIKVFYDYQNITYQAEDLTFTKLVKKYIWYGIGDFEYASLYYKYFSIKKIIASIFSISETYFLKLPFFSLKKNKYQFIPFYFFLGLVRYFSWLVAALKKN